MAKGVVGKISRCNRFMAYLSYRYTSGSAVYRNGQSYAEKVSPGMPEEGKNLEIPATVKDVLIGRRFQETITNEAQKFKAQSKKTQLQPCFLPKYYNSSTNFNSVVSNNVYVNRKF